MLLVRGLDMASKWGNDYDKCIPCFSTFRCFLRLHYSLKYLALHYYQKYVKILNLDFAILSLIEEDIPFNYLSS